MLVVLKRIPALVVTLLVVSFLTFMLTSLLPGDPALLYIGENPTAEQLAAVREELGLDRSIPERYWSWLGDAVTGDLGRSFRTNQEVVEAIKERLPITLEIAALAILIGLAISLPLGTYTAYRAGKTVDKAATAATFGLLSIPSFMLALLLIYIFAVELGTLPATGWHPLTDDPIENLRSAALPALSLAIAEVAAYTRLLRTDMISTLQQDFVLMAKSKGLPQWWILIRHALRPSSLSLVTIVGLNVGGLLGGALIVETIFALPGVGRLLVDSIFQRDYPVVQGCLLLTALMYVLVNLVVDLFYPLFDPRVAVE